MDEISYKIDLSIVIINYNSYDLSKETLETLIFNTNEIIYEIIIVDNNSTDGSLEKLQNEFQELIFIKNAENLGFAKANNIGMKIAKGKYLLFLNNDIIFLENSLKQLIDFLESKKNDSILVAPQLLNSDYSVQMSTYSFQTLWLTFTTNCFLYLLFPKSKYFNKYYFFNQQNWEISEVDTITGAFILGKRNEILKLSGFDEDFFFYGEDNDLCYRFRKKGGKVVYFPKTKIIHLKGGSTKGNSWFVSKNRTIALYKLFEKHFKSPKREVAIIITYLGNLIRLFIAIILYMLKKSDKVTTQNYLKTLKINPFKP